MQMKAVLLIGRYCAATQRMSEYLGKYFLIQLCSDNPLMLKRSLEMSVPDIAIVSLTAMSQSNSELLSVVREFHVPCICMGTIAEQDTVGLYFRSQQFRPMQRTVEDGELLTAIREVLEVVPDERRKNILLVDDNPMQLRALRAMLQRDYDVTMALSGAEALAAIGKRVPDLIFLDYEMPVCNGEMTLRMIRELDKAKDVPVVFLTAVQDRKHIVSVLALKPAAYLLKPTSQEKIEETVKKLI